MCAVGGWGPMFGTKSQINTFFFDTFPQEVQKVLESNTGKGLGPQLVFTEDIKDGIVVLVEAKKLVVGVFYTHVVLTANPKHWPRQYNTM